MSSPLTEPIHEEIASISEFVAIFLNENTAQECLGDGNPSRPGDE